MIQRVRGGRGFSKSPPASRVARKDGFPKGTISQTKAAN